MDKNKQFRTADGLHKKATLLITKGGYLVNYYGFFFFTTPSPQFDFRAWRRTKQTGECLTKEEYIRLKNEIGLSERELTPRELDKAEVIALLLAGNPCMGISLEELKGMVKKGILYPNYTFCKVVIFEKYVGKKTYKDKTAA